jgi:hypothetical protein
MLSDKQSSNVAKLHDVTSQESLHSRCCENLSDNLPIFPFHSQVLPTSVTVFNVTKSNIQSFSNLKMEAASVSEILVSTYQTTRYHIIEYNQTNIYLHRL